jgi:hypothetical protein
MNRNPGSDAARKVDAVATNNLVEIEHVKPTHDTEMSWLAEPEMHIHENRECRVADLAKSRRACNAQLEGPHSDTKAVFGSLDQALYFQNAE